MIYKYKITFIKDNELFKDEGNRLTLEDILELVYKIKETTTIIEVFIWKTQKSI